MGRQAVVVIHGMGEQRPLETLTRFVEVALARDTRQQPLFYSKPESITGSLESRRFLAPTFDNGKVRRRQTEFFEYHWAEKMQGNRLDDLWPTFRRMMLCWPWRVPAGLRGVWGVCWLLLISLGWAVGWGPLRSVWIDGDDLVIGVVGALISSAALAAVLSYAFSRLLPGWLTASFVDVVRYLDTSPRSYGVRRDIRKGLLEMLQALHEDTDTDGDQRYERIVVVAHSLGAYIAYDAITHLWGLTASTTAQGEPDLAGISDLEKCAERLTAEGKGETCDVEAYQDAQTALFEGLRQTGNPWLITDFVSVGTPMYFADRLIPGKGSLSFKERKKRHELPTCPPMPERDGRDRTPYSWRKGNTRQVLHEGAPFAVVRWTNLYFPTKFVFFGDWFGGELVPVFGPGIKDVPIEGGSRWRFVPAWAHSIYFRFPNNSEPKSVTAELHDAMNLYQPVDERDGTRDSPAATDSAGREVHVAAAQGARPGYRAGDESGTTRVHDQVKTLGESDA